MTQETLQKHLEEAVNRINELPESQRPALLALVEETRDRHAQLKDNFAKITESMDEWRVTMKYMLFDREASQREIAELRRKLEEREGQ